MPSPPDEVTVRTVDSSGWKGRGRLPSPATRPASAIGSATVSGTAYRRRTPTDM